MLTSNVGEAGGFVRLDPGSSIPEMQFHMAPGFFLSHGFDKPAGDGLSIGPTLVRIDSRGSIRLRSRHWQDAPRIDPNYYGDERDLERMVQGVKIALKIAASPSLSRYLGARYTPGAHLQTDDELRAFCRESSETLYHPAGTCQMGTGPQAVVDPTLKVHGIDGLWVVDTSVMPTLVNANTNVPTMAIAAKASTHILADL